MGEPSHRLVVAGQLGANLRRLREVTGASQGDLARRADVNRTQVNQIEHGRRVPRVDTLVKLASSLGVTPNDLLVGIDWEPVKQRDGGFSLEPGGGDRDAG